MSTNKQLPKSSPYYLPAQALRELSKVLDYNDKCTNVVERITRSEVLDLLGTNGWWSGSFKGLTKLLKANFGRTLQAGGNTPHVAPQATGKELVKTLKLTTKEVEAGERLAEPKKRALPKPVVVRLTKILKAHDSEKQPVTRAELIDLLNNEYGLGVGSASSLNRLLKANFGRTLNF